MKTFHWFNEPKEHSLINDTLTLHTEENTDFWQRTHYGFQRDNGHCYLRTASGDFTIETQTTFAPEAQYDQCGLFARIDSDNWIKCSVEYENPTLSRLGSVITNLGYSDWASQDITTPITSIWFKLTREKNDFIIEQSTDGQTWEQMRVTHLHKAENTLDMGLYACSPTGKGFTCSFNHTSLK